MSDKLWVRTGTNPDIGGPISGTIIGVEGRLGADTVVHAHGGSGMIHYYKAGITASEDVILIDLSDTVNYPHLETTAIHMAWFNYDIDPSSDADYLLQIGFLENVDLTNGDFYELFRVSGSRKTGNAKGGFFPMSPHGPSCSSGKIASSVSSLNDIAFQTNVNLASTLDPSLANTPSGSGDLIYRLTIDAGTINLVIESSYHAHSD